MQYSGSKLCTSEIWDPETFL